MATIGLIVVNHKTGIDHILCEQHKKRRMGELILLTLMCLFLGWWSIPAFFWNFESLKINLRGGEVIC